VLTGSTMGPFGDRIILYLAPLGWSHIPAGVLMSKVLLQPSITFEV
jgi:hypothetical protein